MGPRVNWLLEKEVRNPGDWWTRRPGIEPTGWHFQFRNAFYPDLDDTAMVVLALKRSPLANDPAVVAATWRGVNWLLSMQNRDGGWAAYDVDIDNQVLTQLPFADHNAMLDPSCADITARVIELLERSASGPTIPRSAALSITCGARKSPRAAGTAAGASTIYTEHGRSCRDSRRSIIRWISLRSRPCEWLESTQQPSGGWGETCRSYDDPTLKGTGETTPSQTAWATLGLVAGGRAFSPAVAMESIISSSPSCPTARGMNRSSPAPDFPGCSTCAITFIAFIFP